MTDTPTQGAIFYEVRSVGQKSNGQLENLFRVSTTALLRTTARGELATYDASGHASVPYAERGECGSF